MIKESAPHVYRHQLENIIKEKNCKTTQGVLDILYGNHWNDYQTDFVIKYRSVKIPPQTFAQRLNTLWVYPLFVVFMPFRYLLYGRSHVDEDSRLGRMVSFLIGEI